MKQEIINALKVIYNDFGPEIFFSDSSCVVKGLTEMTEDSLNFTNLWRYVIDSGIGRLYLPQIKTDRMPDRDFFISVNEFLCGLNISKEGAYDLIISLNRVLGWKDFSIQADDSDESEDKDIMQLPVEIKFDYNKYIGMDDGIGDGNEVAVKEEDEKGSVVVAIWFSIVIIVLGLVLGIVYSK